MQADIRARAKAVPSERVPIRVRRTNIEWSPKYEQWAWVKKQYIVIEGHHKTAEIVPRRARGEDSLWPSG